MKQAIWDRFCDRFNVMELAVPLFETDPDGRVQSKPIGKDGMRRLRVLEDLGHALVIMSGRKTSGRKPS